MKPILPQVAGDAISRNGTTMSWRKSWPSPNLDPNGTKRSLTPAQRSVWDDCLDLAEMSPATGTICAVPSVPYTSEQLAIIFKTPKSVIEDALNLFCTLKMLKKDGTILQWKKYQSEYQRQKGYRSKLHKKVTTHSTPTMCNTDTESDTESDAESEPTKVTSTETTHSEQPHQTLINRFLELKGTSRAALTPAQVSGAYKRHSRSALALIAEAGGLDHALVALDCGAAYFERKSLTWTLDTIAKHLPDVGRYTDELACARHGFTANQLAQFRQLATWLARAPEPSPPGHVSGADGAGVSHVQPRP